jgi:hypothetical protein
VLGVPLIMVPDSVQQAQVWLAADRQCLQGMQKIHDSAMAV